MGGGEGESRRGEKEGEVKGERWVKEDWRKRRRRKWR